MKLRNIRNTMKKNQKYLVVPFSSLFYQGYAPDAWSITKGRAVFNNTIFFHKFAA